MDVPEMERSKKRDGVLHFSSEWPPAAAGTLVIENNWKKTGTQKKTLCRTLALKLGIHCAIYQ